jgi:hypothetical protein
MVVLNDNVVAVSDGLLVNRFRGVEAGLRCLVSEGRGETTVCKVESMKIYVEVE